MSPLRRRLIEDMQIRNLAPSTQRAYVAQLVHFACYFRKSPDLLGPAEIRGWNISVTSDLAHSKTCWIWGVVRGSLLGTLDDGRTSRVVSWASTSAPTLSRR